MKQVSVVTEEQASFARLYEKVLSSYPFLTFVSVVANPVDVNLFEVFVGGPRYLGVRALELGTAGVLDGRKKISPRRKDHRFLILAKVGAAGAVARQEYDSAHRPMHGLRKREHEEIQG